MSENEMWYLLNHMQLIIQMINSQNLSIISLFEKICVQIYNSLWDNSTSHIFLTRNLHYIIWSLEKKNLVINESNLLILIQFKMLELKQVLVSLTWRILKIASFSKITMVSKATSPKNLGISLELLGIKENNIVEQVESHPTIS